MIKTRDIMACLPLLASILGDRYGVKVVIGGNKARTDGKTIYLPTLPLDCDETLLALARGYCDHEAAHIRHTDFEALRLAQLTPTQTHLWNSIEDWRVETQLASIFPGCRRQFQRLIQMFFGKEDDGTGTNPALSILNWVLRTVRAWDLPAIAWQRDKEAAVVDSIFPGLRAKLESVLSRVQQSCRSTKESIGYALELADIIAKYVQQQAQAQQDAKQKAKPPMSGTFVDPGQQEEGKKSDTEDSPDKADTQKTDEEQGTPDTPDDLESEAQSDEPTEGADDSTDSVSQADDEDASDSEAQSHQSEPTQQLTELLQASAKVLPKQLGELMAESLNAQLKTCVQHGLSVARIGRKSTTPLPDTLREDALKSCVALRARLQALLQAKAQKPCVTGRRGKLHTQRLYALAVNNPRVFIKPGEKLLTSTAVHLLLDCSGSMQGGRMELASLACFAVAAALGGCKGVNVGVTLFPAHSADEKTVAPLVRHGERVHRKFNMCSFGNTPLAESLWRVMQQMYPLREERKIILVLSDGAPDSIPATHHAFNRGEAMGFEMMGLGIQDNHMSRLLPKTSRTIDDLQGLAPAMFDMLQKALLHQEGGKS